MDNILPHLISGIVGLLLATIFDEPLSSMKARLIRTARRFFYRRRGPVEIPRPETFSLGSTKTSWLVIDGDGNLTYTPETLICRVEDTPVEIPPEVKLLREEIEQREESKKAQGLQYHWNGPLYALARYAISRTVPDERMKVVLTFRPSDYFTFQATVMSLDTNLLDAPAVLTLRQKYLRGHDFSQPIESLSSGFGMALLILTTDEKFIFAHRADDVGVRSGELDVSVVEGMHPILDRASNHPGPDPYRTAIRGAKEELGVDLLQSDITFLGFGVDVEYYNWGLVGLARSSVTAEQILESRKRGTGGKWETKTFECVNARPRSVFHYLKGKKMWSVGWVTVYWALVHEWGESQVDTAAREISL